MADSDNHYAGFDAYEFVVVRPAETAVLWTRRGELTAMPTEATPDFVMSIPDRIQGTAITEDSVVLSQSFARNVDSSLSRFARPDLAGAHGPAPHCQPGRLDRV